MREVLPFVWLIGCSTILPIVIIWFVTRKQINETNKRKDIIIAALEKNPDINVTEWLEKLTPQEKGKLIKEKLVARLTWSIILLVLGIGLILAVLFVPQVSSVIEPVLPGFLGGTFLAIGIALAVSFVYGKKYFAEEIEAEERKTVQE